MSCISITNKDNEKIKIKILKQKWQNAEDRKREKKILTRDSIIESDRRMNEVGKTFKGLFKIEEFVTKYKRMYGNTNPHTLKDVDVNYNLDASIRSKFYELSPSSQQHWYRYGTFHDVPQRMLFVNKELAKVNDMFQWKKTTPELIKERFKANLKNNKKIGCI